MGSQLGSRMEHSGCVFHFPTFFVLTVVEYGSRAKDLYTDTKLSILILSIDNKH